MDPPIYTTRAAARHPPPKNDSPIHDSVEPSWRVLLIKRFELTVKMFPIFGSAHADSSSLLFAKHLRKTVRHLCACCCGQLAKALYHASLVNGSYLIEHYLSLLALK
jgi:hypothetical protein